MSIKPAAIWAPAPTTERGRPTPLSADSEGQRLAYANAKSVFLRSIDEPARSTQYTQHTAPTTVARFAPSGNYVASGDAAGTVRVWDCVGEGATKGEFQIVRRVHDLAWDGDGQRLIAVGDGKERFGHCFTWDSGNSVGEITGHQAPINAVALRQQRPFRAATGSDDASLVFYHGAPFKFNAMLKGQHNRFVYGVAFSPDGSMLVSVGADKKIWLYDGKTGETKRQIGEGEHTGSIFAVSWAADSKRFVTSSADQTVKVWDAEAGKPTQTWRIGDESAVSVPDHQVGVVWPAGRADGLIVSLSLGGDLNYLTEGAPAPRRTVHGHQRNVTALAAAPSAPPTLFTGSADGRVCAWPADTGAAEFLDGAGHGQYVSGLAAAPDGRRVASVGWDDTLRSADPAACTFTGAALPTRGQPRGLAALADCAVVATPTGLQVVAGDREASFLETPYAPACVAAHGATVVAGGDDAALHVYALAGGRLAHRADVPQAGPLPTALAFAPDGGLLAAGFANGKILVFDATKGEEWPVAITRWSSHTGRVTALAWRADGKFAVSGSLDTAVFVWSVESPGKRISVMNAHKEGVNGVCFQGDKKVISAGMDAAVKAWDVDGLPRTA